MRRRTDAEFKETLKNIKPNIECLDIYLGNKTKILFKCLTCGNEWYTIPERVLGKYGCPECGKIQLKKSVFINTLEKINAIIQGKFSMNEPYCGDKSYEFKCLKCGKVLKLKSSSILKAKKLECDCSSNKPNHYDLNSFIKTANEIHNNKYNYDKLVFNNTNNKGIITCPIHGDFEQTLKSHLKGQGCPLCANDIRRKSTEEFIKQSKNIHKDYDYSKVEYINNHTPIIITCPKHGDFLQTPTHHLRGQGCPKCNSSKGEEKVELFLQKHQINYIAQYTINIDNCINKSNTMRIDFYLPDYNCFIEYNGILHYIPVEAFGGSLQFEKLQIRDSQLREYCSKQKIVLIEIKYDINIDEYLNEQFRQINII